MATDFDAIVVGSGFGGSVVAARLAERGYRVLVLERGRRWQVHEYPRKPGDAWLWDDRSPERCNGWFDFRMFPKMSVVQGAGVGGGSLVYANISIDAKQATFQNGWPPEIRWNDLQTYYARVKGMLRNEPVPDRQWPQRTRLVNEGATDLGWADRFERLDLAVTFDPTWHYGLTDPHNHAHSKSFTNPQGQQQGTCVHLGECDIGCPVKARNTLDLTYIPLAERHHADVRPLHIVRSIAPATQGYRVHYERIANGTLFSGSASGRLVILSAGSLGSTELLLRCRDVHGTLTNLSPMLGRHWSSNGDFLTPAIHPFRNVQPTRGPTITSAINLLDGTVNGRDIFIEDGGLPDVARGFMQELAGKQGDTEQETVLIESVQWLTRLDLFRNLMPWFAQGRDAADGVLSLRDGRVFLHWDVAQSEATINAIVETHQRLAMSTGGAAIVPPAWASSKELITPHPLGGAKMGTSRENGVVDHKGEVFGHRNLFVADGAIVPKALGLNPSKTIAALAERVAEFIAVEGR